MIGIPPQAKIALYAGIFITGMWANNVWHKSKMVDAIVKEGKQAVKNKEIGGSAAEKLAGKKAKRGIVNRVITKEVIKYVQNDQGADTICFDDRSRVLWDNISKGRNPSGKAR